MDNVNNPPHYNAGKIETIECIESALGHQGFIDYCIGNVLKYTSRWRHKGGLEDLHKAQWYLNRAVSTIEVTSPDYESRRGIRDLFHGGYSDTVDTE